MSSLATPVSLTAFGVWLGETVVTGDIARGLEAQGHGALWLGSADGEVLDGARVAVPPPRSGSPRAPRGQRAPDGHRSRRLE